MNALQQEIMRIRTRIQILGRDAYGSKWEEDGYRLFESLTKELANLAWVAAQAAGNNPPTSQGEGEPL